MSEQASVLDVTVLLKSDGAAKSFEFDVPVGETDPRFSGVTAAIRFKNLSGVLTCKGEILGSYAAECDRCLRSFVLPLRAVIDTVVASDESKDDSVTVKGGRIDLVKTCYDALSLELPMTLLCREDCKGLCPVCGADRNETDCGCETDQ